MKIERAADRQPMVQSADGGGISTIDASDGRSFGHIAAGEAEDFTANRSCALARATGPR